MQGSIETRVGIFVLMALSIFMYMGFHIGAFRFDRGKYYPYMLTFKDVSGLSRKAEVKISGVRVGWVEKIDLQDNTQAVAQVMVFKDLNLYEDAHAIVRQDGFLGPKYIELLPGDPLLPKLQKGEMLSKPSVAPVSIDELLHQFKRIASSVEEVTTSLKTAVGGPQGEEQLSNIVNNIHEASERLSSFATTIDRTFSRNEENMDRFLEMGVEVQKISKQLQESVLPAVQDGVEKISSSFDRDFNRIATKIESAADSFEDISLQARDGLRNFSSIAEKIDEGKGLIGKLINEDETYRDIKVAVQGVKNYFSKIETIQVIMDSHFETMGRQAEYYRFEDSKGYFGLRIHPTEDHFYLVQLVSSEKGFINRQRVNREYRDREGEIIDCDFSKLTEFEKLRFAPTKDKEYIYRNTVRFGLQVGKIFGDIALRIGLFDGTAGAGVDFEIPFRTEKLRWLTSFEMFDTRGWNRTDDRRPHLKWINRVYFMRNLYATFGADDFVSKRNANVFFGFGLRFCDDDVKYLVSSLGSARGMVANNCNS